MADPDPLNELREQIRMTEQAARKLAGEATGARARERSGEVPPAGWASPEDHAQRQSEVQQLAALLGSLRDLVPPELAGQVREVLRQVLLLLRALIDWWVERMDVAAGQPRAAAGHPDDRLTDIPLA